MTAGGPLSIRSIVARLQAFALRSDWTRNVTLSGSITPSALSSNTNDYNPPGLADALFIKVSATTPVNLTGLAGGSAGVVKVIQNVGSNTITLPHFDAGSSTANRFFFGSQGPLTLVRGQAVVLYHATVWNALTACEISTVNAGPGLVRPDGNSTHVLTGTSAWATGEFPTNKDTPNGYAGLDTYGLLPIERLPQLYYPGTLSTGYVQLTVTEFDCTDPRTFIHAPRRTSLSSRAGHLTTVVVDGSHIDVTSDDSADDGNVEVIVQGVPIW